MDKFLAYKRPYIERRILVKCGQKGRSDLFAVTSKPYFHKSLLEIKHLFNYILTKKVPILRSCL
jgi:hypothetical protein